MGSTAPSAALAAMAASIADPPRARTCAPACEASVWLVATMPWREITMERASDLSCGWAGLGMDNQMKLRPIAAWNLFAGRVIGTGDYSGWRISGATASDCDNLRIREPL